MPSLIENLYSGKVVGKKRYDVFRNIDKIFPTRTIKRGKNVFSLPRSADFRKEFYFLNGKHYYDLDNFMELNDICGVLVIKDGEIKLEKYALDNSEKSRWGSWSIAKSISSTLVGFALKDGYIKSLNDSLVKYMPELKGGAYDGVTIKQVLTMTSGVRWQEGYENPNSERRRMLKLQIDQKPGAIVKYLNSLKRDEPGKFFLYSTGETHILGALIKAATGKFLSNYLSEKLWSKMGMESDATWWLESPKGLEIGGSGISATLRDYGRFGQFVLNEWNSPQITPNTWFQDAGSNNASYGYMWWPGRDSSFSAIGIFGQQIYINPEKNIVIVIWGGSQHACGGGTGNLLPSIIEAFK